MSRRCGITSEKDCYRRQPAGLRAIASITPQAVKRLGFIQRAKELGFSLGEIRELLSLQDDEDSGDRAEIKAIADGKVVQLEVKIRDLERMRTMLAQLSEECSGEGPVKGCPIIEALQSEGRNS